MMGIRIMGGKLVEHQVVFHYDSCLAVLSTSASSCLQLPPVNTHMYDMTYVWQ